MVADSGLLHRTSPQKPRFISGVMLTCTDHFLQGWAEASFELLALILDAETEVQKVTSWGPSP